jgi:hypothetical protein
MPVKISVASTLRALIARLTNRVLALENAIPPTPPATAAPQTLTAAGVSGNVLTGPVTTTIPYTFVAPSYSVAYRILIIKGRASMSITKPADGPQVMQAFKVTLSTDEDAVNLGVFNALIPSNALSARVMTSDFLFMIILPGGAPVSSGTIRMLMQYNNINSGNLIASTTAIGDLTAQMVYIH